MKGDKGCSNKIFYLFEYAYGHTGLCADDAQPNNKLDPDPRAPLPA